MLPSEQHLSWRYDCVYKLKTPTFSLQYIINSHKILHLEILYILCTGTEIRQRLPFLCFSFQ